MTRHSVPLLNSRTVGGYLIRAGLIGPGVVPSVAELGGGVSNVVLSVDAGDRHWVVKQSLPRLRVAREWLATQERTVHEARGLAVAARITPGAVPGVVRLDSDAYVLVQERAPDGMGNWKASLMDGDVDPAVAARLGWLLGRWHTVTADHPRMLAGLDDPEAFEQLRVGPYHRAVAAALPRVAPSVDALVRAMAGRRICLVHGDFSPKNVLTGPPGTWVIDFEVAHRGDPDFDVAFLLCHLACKYVHLPGSRAALAEAGRAFLSAYRAVVGVPPWWAPDRHRMAHVGALLLARVVGKSPVEYLDDAERDAVRRLGTALLMDPPGDVALLWPICEEMLGMVR